MAETTKNKTKSKARIINVKSTLKEKVGHGGFKQEDILNAQDELDNNQIDFMPMAKKLIGLLNEAITEAEKKTGNDLKILGDIVFPIQQLKSQGSMFGCPVYTDMSVDILRFLEDIKTIDNNILKILSSFYRALQTIHKLQIKESSDPTVKLLNVELKGVYGRYLKHI